LESALKNLHSQDRGAASPYRPAEGCKNGVGSRSSANRAAAEEELAQKSCQGDKAAEVEKTVEDLDGKVGVGMRCCEGSVCGQKSKVIQIESRTLGPKAGRDLKVGDRDEGE